MAWKRGMIAVGALALSVAAYAGDLKIKIPKRSQSTPVQRLNREGVEAVRKHNYDKAESLFYKAYLLDPEDPFTLNNLGYISELQGQVDRAQQFYELASEEPTDAVIDYASSERVQGQAMKDALAIPGSQLGLNHANVEAVRLLSQGRAPEADMLLQSALKSDPHNVFTLNNLGVAKEMEGESQEALKYYDAAAGSNANAAAIVTVNRAWRGKPVNEMAAQNAKNLRARLESRQGRESELAELNLRGVSAINRNDLAAADKDFRAAYALDPNNAFALNNIGYVAEMEGDRETAQFFYDKARAAAGANLVVGMASRRSAEGQRLTQVATDSDSKVEARVAQERIIRRGQREPVALRRRDNSIVEEPSATSPSIQVVNPSQ